MILMPLDYLALFMMILPLPVAMFILALATLLLFLGKLLIVYPIETFVAIIVIALLKS